MPLVQDISVDFSPRIDITITGDAAADFVDLVKALIAKTKEAGFRKLCLDTKQKKVLDEIWKQTADSLSCQG
jgi:biopolymer transport protein ExbD